MRILITGGRKMNDLTVIEEILSDFFSQHGLVHELLIHGNAVGVDQIVAEYFDYIGVETLSVPVTKEEWQKFGKVAGSLRNQKMLDMKPDILLNFPGGNGTLDCINRAKKMGIPVFREYVRYV